MAGPSAAFGMAGECPLPAAYGFIYAYPPDSGGRVRKRHEKRNRIDENIMEQAQGGWISWETDGDTVDSFHVGEVMGEDDRGLLLLTVDMDGKADGIEYVEKGFCPELKWARGRQRP